MVIGVVRPYVTKRILFAITKRRGDGNLEEEAPHDCLKAWRDQFDERNLSFAGKHVLEVGSGRPTLHYRCWLHLQIE